MSAKGLARKSLGKLSSSGSVVYICVVSVLSCLEVGFKIKLERKGFQRRLKPVPVFLMCCNCGHFSKILKKNELLINPTLYLLG